MDVQVGGISRDVEADPDLCRHRGAILGSAAHAEGPQSSGNPVSNILEFSGKVENGEVAVAAGLGTVEKQLGRQVLKNGRGVRCSLGWEPERYYEK